MINFWNIINEVKENKAKAETLDKLGEVTSEIVSPSDKVGFDFKVYKVNGVEVSKEYVSNGLAKGTEGNPLYFKEGEQNDMSPNLYYYYNDHIYVYMDNEYRIAFEWSEVEDKMAQWDIE